MIDTRTFCHARLPYFLYSLYLLPESRVKLVRLSFALNFSRTNGRHYTSTLVHLTPPTSTSRLMHSIT